VNGAGEQQARPTGDLRLGAASAASRRAPARASSRRTRTDDAAVAAFATPRPVTLEVLNQRIEALTAAVARLTPPTLVSVAQAAVQLGVSEVTVRRRVRDGKLPHKRVGRSIRVDLRGL
jgi:excisionase family DNA binding protein